MVDENVRRHWSENRLLAAVPAIDRAMLEPHAEFVELARGQVLFQPEQDVVITHFPLTGSMAALVVVLEDGRTAEAASIRRERRHRRYRQRGQQARVLQGGDPNRGPGASD
jgi:hypothetical protein